MILNRDNKGRITVKKCFVLHKEVIGVFHGKVYIATIEKLSFDFIMFRLLVQWNMGRLEIIFPALMHQKTI